MTIDEVIKLLGDAAEGSVLLDLECMIAGGEVAAGTRYFREKVALCRGQDIAR